MYIDCDATLADKALRKQWEKEFYQACAQPVLQNVQKHHQQALNLIANDDKQGNLKLYGYALLKWKCYGSTFNTIMALFVLFLGSKQSKTRL